MLVNLERSRHSATSDGISYDRPFQVAKSCRVLVLALRFEQHVSSSTLSFLLITSVHFKQAGVIKNEEFIDQRDDDPGSP
jgi:hypothetical protein